MMGRRFLSIAVILFLVAAAGCRKTEGDKEAIRTALQKHLAERGNVNIAAMDVEVKQVTVDGNRAVAQVEFRAKQGGPAMQMTYNLQREGGTWVVLTKYSPGGEMGHPSTGPAMPPPGSGNLPAGHPPLTEPGKADVPPSKKR